MRGRLKWYNRVKGYGFVEHEGRDLFFHHTNIAMDKKDVVKLAGKDGADVEFEEVVSDRGPKADKVRVVEAQAS